MAVVNRRLLQPGDRIRVMVVDDSVVIRRLVTQALEQDGMIEVVGTASNGAIGLQRIPQFNPDVITLDIEMPDMNGLEMLRRIRREHPLHLAISKQWKIHYFSAAMRDHAEHRAEEARFLANMPGVLGEGAMAALERLSAAIGLDYGGIDFSLGQNGAILLFEANATMVVEQPDGDPCWNYRRAAVERIHAAVRDLLLSGAGAKQVVNSSSNLAPMTRPLTHVSADSRK
jgi:CheY-like chemotaxis protein